MARLKPGSKTARLKWNTGRMVTKPNPKAQKALEKVACKMKRIAMRYGIHYVSMFTFVDGTVDITARDINDNYVVEEHATWKK